MFRDDLSEMLFAPHEAGIDPYLMLTWTIFICRFDVKTFQIKIICKHRKYIFAFLDQDDIKTRQAVATSISQKTRDTEQVLG